MDNRRPRILISCSHLQETFDRYADTFEAAGIEVELPEVEQALREEELVRMIDRFDGAIVGDDEISERVLDEADNLAVIVKWGIGVDGIDIETAKERGIPVHNTPGMFGDEVADVVVGYLVMLARHLHEIDRSVRDGSWHQPRGTSLGGKTLGIVGVGSIGEAVAQRGAAMGMDLVGHDVVPIDKTVVEETGLEPLDLDELLEHADAISLNCPLTEDTHHLLDREAFARMQEGTLLVNTARGPLIDEGALLEALEDDTVAGAALDVFETEPLPEDHPLIERDDVILGAHNSSNTLEAVLRTNEEAIEILFDELGVQA